jgi:alpha-glucosidase
MAGMQRYAQTWSGDNYTAWKTLRFNQKMAIGMALSGVSNTGHDIGGFAGPAPEPELLLRWVQAGIVMPRFSIHSWNTDGTVNEPWMYPEATPAIVGMMKLRRALQPLLHDLLWRHHADYAPVTRPLWLNFPQDPKAWEDGDVHLLGPDIVVAPAMDPGIDQVRAYLPAGAVWRDLRDDQAYVGGAEVALAAPLEGLPPMLAREGSGVFLDLAPAGFAPAPPEPAVLLYPPVSGVMDWRGFDEADSGWRDPARPQGWRVTVDASADALTLTVAWAGETPPPAQTLTLVLPAAESRAIVLNGEVTTPRLDSVLGVQRRVLRWAV